MIEPGAEREVPSVSDVPVPSPAGRVDVVRGMLGRQQIRGMLGREEIRYLVVAGSTTLCYLAILAVLLLTGLHYMIAIAIAQVVVISAAFPTYRRLIFRSTGRWQSDLPRFVGVWSGGLIAGIVATPALVELAGLAPLPAQVIAVAVVAILSYLGHKYVSFRR